jgi:hypothetical protein
VHERAIIGAQGGNARLELVHRFGRDFRSGSEHFEVADAAHAGHVHRVERNARCRRICKCRDAREQPFMNTGDTRIHQRRFIEHVRAHFGEQPQPLPKRHSFEHPAQRCQLEMRVRVDETGNEDARRDILPIGVGHAGAVTDINDFRVLDDDPPTPDGRGRNREHPLCGIRGAAHRYGALTGRQGASAES